MEGMTKTIYKGYDQFKLINVQADLKLLYLP